MPDRRSGPVPVQTASYKHPLNDILCTIIFANGVIKKVSTLYYTQVAHKRHIKKQTIPSQIVCLNTIEKPNNYFQSVNYACNK